MNGPFICAGCGKVIPKDKFKTEQAWRAACCDHYDEAHPELRARAGRSR